MTEAHRHGARVPIEGYAVETHDGLIFTVKGAVHPPDRIVAYLRYVPDPAGGRSRGGRIYRRVYRFQEQLDVLRARGPMYLAADPMFGVSLQSVPVSEVVRTYDPCRRLRRLLESGPTDPLEASALALARLVQTTSAAQWSSLGLTGSILLGLHEPSSDIDLVVYGEDEARAVHDALWSLLGDRSSPVRRPEGDHLDALHDVHRVETPLSPTDFKRSQGRKVNEGRYDGRAFFVRFVKWPSQSPERYGDPRFEPVGEAVIRARVSADGEAMFTPCRYLVSDVSFVEGGAAPPPCEIVSFRGRFADQAVAGTRVRARGCLERVISSAGAEHRRLIVGGLPGDYLVEAVD